ncbi:MAG: hypothetical protein AAGU75_04540 [Bacillota bacterium]
MNKGKNIIIGVTAAAVVLSSGVMAFAATDPTSSQIGKGRASIISDLSDTQRQSVRQAYTDSMQEAVAELVGSGTITQDTADKLSETRGMTMDKGSMGTLTEEQRTALHEEETALFESQLNKLVNDGTLTQDQADQMTQGQGHKMMKDLNLTEEQRNAVMQAKTNAIKEAAANLVEKGALTQDEADAISAMPSKIKQDGTGTSRILTEEQRTALSEAMKATLESKLSDLVDDGTLTQDQADQLLNANQKRK